SPTVDARERPVDVRRPAAGKLRPPRSGVVVKAARRQRAATSGGVKQLLGSDPISGSDSSLTALRVRICLMASTLSDRELVSRCRAGDQQAWNELVERFSRYVYAISVQAF